MIDYDSYIALVDQTYNHFGWRYGQTIMNVLHATNINKYNQIISSEYDCYYNDRLIPKTLSFLQENWNQ